MPDLEFSHVGFVVDDLQTAMTMLGAGLGITWAESAVVGGEFTFPTGSRPWRSHVVFSCGGPGQFELIEQLDPSGWATLPGGRYFHHLGFWSEDLAADSERMEVEGFPRMVNGEGPHGEISDLALHLNPFSGVWFELLAPSTRGDLETWMSGGGFPLDRPGHMEGTRRDDE